MSIQPIQILLKMKKNIPSEHQEQVEVVNYCKANNIPVAAVPNGFFNASRDGKFYGQISKLKAEGLAKGFPDLLVFLPNKLLMVEMKRKRGGTLSKEQKQWHDDLAALGHDVAVAHGAEMAIDIIEGARNAG